MGPRVAGRERPRNRPPEQVGSGGDESRRGEFVGSYPFERLNQIIFVYHVIGGPGEIRLATDELADYKEVPIEKIRPWPHGTGPGLRDWLAKRGFHPPVAEFGTPQET